MASSTRATTLSWESSTAGSGRRPTPPRVPQFPADVRVLPDGGGGGGSGGGGGGGGGGGSGGAGSTPSGGLPGNVSFIPQFKQFTNRAIIALGNGFPPQIFADSSGTGVNPATVAVIS